MPKKGVPVGIVFFNCIENCSRLHFSCRIPLQKTYSTQYTAFYFFSIKHSCIYRSCCARQREWISPQQSMCCTLFTIILYINNGAIKWQHKKTTNINALQCTICMSTKLCCCVNSVIFQKQCHEVHTITILCSLPSAYIMLPYGTQIILPYTT